MMLQEEEMDQKGERVFTQSKVRQKQNNKQNDNSAESAKRMTSK